MTVSGILLRIFDHIFVYELHIARGIGLPLLLILVPADLCLGHITIRIIGIVLPLDGFSDAPPVRVGSACLSRIDARLDLLPGNDIVYDAVGPSRPGENTIYLRRFPKA